jgi:hypothetical protein
MFSAESLLEGRHEVLNSSVSYEGDDGFFLLLCIP